MHKSLCTSYNNAVVKAYSEALQKASRALRATLPSEHTRESEAMWIEESISIIEETKAGLSGWTATLDQRKLLDPLTHERNELANELSQLTASVAPASLPSPALYLPLQPHP